MKRGHALALATLLLAFVPTASQVQGGGQVLVRYDETERQSGIYFTGTATGAFVRCGPDAAACTDGASPKERYQVDCAPEACADLKARIGALTNSTDQRNRFAVEFTGRTSFAPDKYVLVERVESMTLLDTK